MGDVLGVLLDLDLLEMRFFLNGRDLGAAFVGIQAEGLFPGASLNVGQAARFNFGHAPFLHPPSTTDGLPFHAVAEASGARGLNSSRILRNVGRSDMAHHAFEDHAGSRHGSRGVADGGDVWRVKYRTACHKIIRITVTLQKPQPVDHHFPETGCPLKTGTFHRQYLSLLSTLQHTRKISLPPAKHGYSC